MRVTLAIIVVCVVVFVVQNLVAGFTETFSLIPAYALSGQYWQFITYMFLHGSTWHIAINMFVLFIFGVVIERAMGWKWYITVFIVSGFGSALLHIILSGQSMVLLLGASGGVFGILTAYAFMFPKNWIIIFPGIPIPAFLAIVFLVIIELFSGMFALEPGIANFGHLGGIATGVIIMLYWKYGHKRRLRSKAKVREFEFYWE